MNGIRLPKEILYPNDTPNVFDLRNEVYKELQNGMKKYIDDLFSVCEPEKQQEILARKPQNTPYMNTLQAFYKGIEIPILDKTEMFLDGISYIPCCQLVDKPIHSQKNGKFIIVKTNMRFSLLKMQGDASIVLTKTGFCPLLIYMLYAYNNDVLFMLTDLGFEITENEDEAEYFIPDFGNRDKNTIIKIKKCEKGKWKNYFLLPFTKENLDWHCEIIDTINTELDKYVSDDTNSENDEITKNNTSSEDKDIEDIVNSDEEISNSKSEINYINDEVSKLEKLRNNNMSSFERKLANEIATTICCYFANTKRGKKVVKKSHVLNTLSKLAVEDMTLKGVSILGMIKECLILDSKLPDATDIGDLSQKMIRFMEWYVLKLLSIRSYPEQSMIVEICKTEPKLNYNNTTNPMAELSLLQRANIFGKGGLPRESCQANIRNLHNSHYGIIDPIDSSSGSNIGISLNLVPEISTFNLEVAMKETDKSNIFKPAESEK